MRVPLKITIGTLSALSVALVAAVTLSIAIPSSLAALRSMGTQHAAALLALSHKDVTGLFAKGTDAVLSVVNATTMQR